MSGMTLWFTKNTVAANLLVLLVLVGGVFSLSSLRIEGFPKIPSSYIIINIAYPGANAEQVDDGVSMKIEKALEGISGVKKVISTSFEAGSQIWIQKETGYDMIRLLNDIKTQVDGVSNFPQKAEKPIITIDEFKDFVLIVQVYGDIDERTLQHSARLLEVELQSHPKISKIESFGKKNTEIRIEIDHKKLKSYGVTLAEVQDFITQNSVEYGFGKLKNDNTKIILRADNKLKNLDQFINLPIIASTDGSIIYLRDVAKIIDGYEENDAKVLFQSNKSIGIILYSSNKGHLIEVSDAAHKVVKRLRKELPEEIKFEIWADYSMYMKDRLSLLQSNAWQGLLIVFVILALFLNFKLAFWVAAGIPFSLAGTFIIMGDSFLGYSLNDVTTLGMIITLGILVDDAVVVGESIYEERQTVSDPIRGTVQGVHKVAVATVFGVLTTIAAFFPMMLIKNDLGRILSSFSMVVIISLIFSLIESKLILPAHLAAISIKSSNPKNIISKLFNKIQATASGGLDWFNKKIYTPLLHMTLKFRYSALIIFLTLALTGVWLLQHGHVRTVFFPDIPGDIINISLDMENGSSAKMTYKNAILIEQAAKQTNEELMEKYKTDNPPIVKIMSAVIGSDEIEIYAELQLQKNRVIDTMELLKIWRSKTINLEGVQSIEFNGNTETGGGFVIKVRSRNASSLESAVNKIVSELKKSKGVYDIRDDLKSGEPEIRLKLKSEARYLGLTPADLASQIGAAYGGFEIDRFQRGIDEVKLKLIYGKKQRQYIYQLLESNITLEDGSLIPLTSVADINSTYSSGFIRRENSQRTVEIHAALDKENVSSQAIFTSLQEKVIKNIKLEFPDIKVTVGGELEEEGEMRGGLKKALIIVLLLIYTLLAIPLKSYWKPFVIMSVIPFGFAGAVAGHLIADIPLSLLSFFGMLALTGIVVNDSLVMLTRFNSLLSEGKPLNNALMLAGTSRFRAVFLTTATTVCGMIPLLLETSEQAQYLIPAAVSLAYGELFATVITLLLIPLLMNIAYDIKGLFHK